MYVLFLQLLDLRRCHFAPVRREFAISLLAHTYDFLIGCSSEQSGEKLFFKYGEMSFQVLEP